jgi:ABC-type multidrug transport system ATPase subunit
MLELAQISVEKARNRILQDISVRYPRAHFGAIIGPSGCGKSSLIKVMAGIWWQTAGTLQWQGRLVDELRLVNPAELGYVPQFSILHDELTVEESLRFTLQLRVGGLGKEESVHRVEQLLNLVGLLEKKDLRTAVLSGGQKRRLGLALELVSTPSLLLCDEVTSGLDLKSEDEIVELLREIAVREQRLVLSVTHSLRHLHLFDSVTFLYQGRLIYQGRADGLLSYFSAESTDDLFGRLTGWEPGEWAKSWEQRRDACALPEFAENTTETGRVKLPVFYKQTWILIRRRLLLFFRNRAQLWLQVALLVIFPLLVSLFGYRGLPQIKNMTLGIDTGLIRELTEALEFNAQLSKIGSLVSGIVMFQVILLALMDSNNAAREVVSLRPLFEKEKLGGMRVGSYLSSTVIFFLGIVLVQSCWMGLFVKQVCGLPGGWEHQVGFLFMVNAAMTAVSFAISSWSRSTEQASLLV